MRLRIAKVAALTAAVLTTGGLSQATGAQAAGGNQISAFTAGLSSLRAGGHPDQSVSFRLATETAPVPGPGAPGVGCLGAEERCVVVTGGAPKDVAVELPLGLVGNPRSMPLCTAQQVSQQSCDPKSQVGVVHLAIILAGLDENNTVPLFNMFPEHGQVAKFGFRAIGTFNGFISVKDRPGDYGLTATAENIFDSNPLFGADVTIWGVPGDPSHDPQRTCSGIALDLGCSYRGPVKPFLEAPSQCASPLADTLKVRSYQRPGDEDWISATSAPQEVVECDRLGFDPTIAVTPDSAAAGSPAGLNVKLRVPQKFSSPIGTETPPLKDAKVTLPSAVSISPSLAAGLAACTDAQFGIGRADLGACPEASKIATATVTTPVLSEAVAGAVYVGTQRSSDPMSGDMYRIFLELRNDERGLDIKLPGRLLVDPNTGRIEARFRDSPQLPFDELNLDFKGGPRAPLTIPSTCGTYQTEYTLTSWAGQSVRGTSPMTINQNCAAASQFTPSLDAGTANPIAGKSSPFTLKVTRPEGQQNVKLVEATLPEGELAKLAGVPLCSEAQAPTGACDAASQIGTTTVGVGAGPNPLYVPQPGKAPTAIYLSGPYKGAPYSLVFKVPAQAGPFDLGTIAVRAAITVDPRSAVVTAKSDPLPQILQGIPLGYRTIYVDVDRAGFMQSPTGCDPMAVTSAITSAQGATANPSSRFQVGSCERLGFAPKLSLKLKGGTKRNEYPQLTAHLKAKQGEANIARVSVALPHSEFLAQNHINTICTRVQFAADNCPKGSIYGYAEAKTPLLDKPLKGPVYLRSSSHPLPDLVAALGGQIKIDLVGRIDSVNGGIRTVFGSVPDAPVSAFTLRMRGGKKSLLVNSTNLCAAPNRATVKMDAHSGKVHDFTPLVGNGWGSRHAGRKGAGK
jgi:hypothetical protein